MSGFRCKIILTERGKMIATAIALQDATKKSVINKMSLGLAGMLYKERNTATDEEFQDMLFHYSAHLSALTASLVMEAVLTKSQLDEMIDTIKEMESMGKDITNE
jgi:metal-responsive CopG/Arc/MetJ family transcriptional regulator